MHNEENQRKFPLLTQVTRVSRTTLQCKDGQNYNNVNQPLRQYQQAQVHILSDIPVRCALSLLQTSASNILTLSSPDPDVNAELATKTWEDVVHMFLRKDLA